MKALTLTSSLAAKLASVIVHAEEYLSLRGHPLDKITLVDALKDPEVKQWLKDIGPLAPVKRNK